MSYSHTDAADADWLHTELERFRTPSSLAGRLTATGVIPKRLTPIFRDRHELAASPDLGAEIREALAASHCLIVLCSPAAAASKWTNAEIEEFKRVHPDGCIIAAIVGGEPFSSETPGSESEECFPPGLRQKYDRRGRPTGKRAEPLAADLREQRDGRRLGILKIVAGMLGVGLDDLVRRDHLGRQRRLAAIAVGSGAGMVVASVLAVSAIQARDDARDQRRQAESLIEFMVGDFKGKLEPLGRLDLLDSVGVRALAYYQQQDPSELSDDALAQRSKALTILGKVAKERGDLVAALGYFRAAFTGTAEALRRSPGDPQRIFDHAQNVFYVGDIAISRGERQQAEAAMREYKRMARQLIAIDPTNPAWQMEGLYADLSLGVMLYDVGRYAEAAAIFENSLVEREKLAMDYPSNPQFERALFDCLAWLASARERQGRLADAVDASERLIDLLEPLVGDPAIDAEYKRLATTAHSSIGRVSAARGDLGAATDHLRNALELANRESADEPANAFALGGVGWASLRLARVRLAAGAVNEASDLVSRGCDIADRLVAKDRGVVEWRIELPSECLEMRTRVALRRGALAEAEEQTEQLVALTATEAARSKSAIAQTEQANAFLMQGLVWRASGDSQAAAKSFRKAAASWPRGAPEPPFQTARRALILKGLGRTEEASQLAAKLERMEYREPIYLHDSQSLG